MQKSHVFNSIREAILKGDLKPGQPVTEDQLSHSLKVSRTPIREALIRLESEGLVRILKNKGAFVREITPVDIAEIFELRILLEGHAARACIPIIAMSDVADLLREFRVLDRGGSGDQAARLELGSRLHDLVVNSAGNLRLKRLVEVLKTQIVWIQSYATLVPGRTDKSFREHIEILEAISRRDGNTAERAMRRHLENTMNELLAVDNLPVLSALMR